MYGVSAVSCLPNPPPPAHASSPPPAASTLQIGFLGKSPNVRIYPNYSDPSIYLQLRFGRVAELDAAGRPVPGHVIPSMAQVGAVNFTSANMTVTDAAGKIVNLSYVNVTLTPFDRPGEQTRASHRRWEGRHEQPRTRRFGSCATGTARTVTAPALCWAPEPT